MCETIGVAYLAYQAEHADDAELRAMAAALYEDELAYATLSWDLVEAFDAHRDSAQKHAIRDAQHRALDAIVCGAARTSQLRESLYRAWPGVAQNSGHAPC